MLEVDCPRPAAEHRAALRRSVLFPNFFSGISSCQLPTRPPILSLYSPPSSSLCLKALPNSLAHENNCSCMFGDRTGSSDGLFSPHGSADGQADRLPPPLPPPSAPLGGKRSCSVKSEVRYLSPEPQSDSEPLISLTCRWSEGPSPEPVSV